MTGWGIVIGQIVILILLTLFHVIWPVMFPVLPSLLTILFAIIIPDYLARKAKNNEAISFLRVSRNELGLKGLPTWTDIGLSPIGFVAYLALAIILTQVFNLLPWLNGFQMHNSTDRFFLNGAEMTVAFLMLAVIVPITEEVIFRGWLYGKLREILLAKVSDRVSMVVSTIIVSFIFGLLHGDWFSAVNMFSLSVILCIMREITGTVYSGMFTHIIKNAVAFCAIMFP